MDLEESESSTQATSAPSGTPSTSSQPLPSQGRSYSTSKRAVAAREKRAQSAIEQGIEPGQWGGKRQQAQLSNSDEPAQAPQQAPQRRTNDACTQTDDGMPQEQDVERLRRLRDLGTGRYLLREYECELEEGREGDISTEPGWASGLISPICAQYR